MYCEGMRDETVNEPSTFDWVRMNDWMSEINENEDACWHAMNIIIYKKIYNKYVVTTTTSKLMRCVWTYEHKMEIEYNVINRFNTRLSILLIGNKLCESCILLNCFRSRL